MDSAAAVTGAFSARKLPSQEQTNEWIDFVIRQLDTYSELPKKTGDAKLSENGMRLINDFRQMLVAYKELGSRKNGDDLLQETIWNLSKGELQPSPENEPTKNEAVDDAQQASSALRRVVNIFWRHIVSWDGGAADLASFTRGLVADTAEAVEKNAGALKNKMRETEGKVQEGEADPVTGIDRAKDEATGTKEKYEKGMDTVKIAGANIIDGGDTMKQTHQELTEKTSQNFDNLFDKALARAENDPEYRSSVTFIFDVLSKWFNKSIDAAPDTSLKSIVHDPTGRVPAAFSSLNKLLERLAGGKSTSDLQEALRVVLIDIRDDSALRAYFDELHDFARRTLQEPNYTRSDEHTRRRQELRTRWKELSDPQVGGRRKWHDDVENLQRQSNDFFGRIERDEDVRRIRETSTVFGNDFQKAVEDLGATPLGDAKWLWGDMADVVLPSIIEKLKGVSIPRTEYKDPETEFVLEDLKLDSFHLLPGHAHIVNTTTMDLSKPSPAAPSNTSVRSNTQVQFKGVKLQIRDASFWYRDPTMKPMSEISGLLGVTLPERGMDVDVRLSVIPQKDKKDKNPTDEHAFFKIDNVTVNLNDPSFTIRKSNHPILFTAFKPLVRSRLERTICTTLEHQLTIAFQTLDNLLYDTYNRQTVFRDTGMSPGAAWVSAVWSEIGHMRKQPGLFSGMQTTGVGIVKDDDRQNFAFAMGAKPQIIDGEKRGPDAPGGTHARQKREQAVEAKEQAKKAVQGGDAGGVTGQATGVVRSFKDQAQTWKEKEEKEDTWRSGAFDPPRKDGKFGVGAAGHKEQNRL